MDAVKTRSPRLLAQEEVQGGKKKGELLLAPNHRVQHNTERHRQAFSGSSALLPVLSLNAWDNFIIFYRCSTD